MLIKRIVFNRLTFAVALLIAMLLFARFVTDMQAGKRSHMDIRNASHIVNTSASLSREVQRIDGTQFCSSFVGFSVFSIEKNKMRVSMIGKNGQIEHIVEKSKNN